MTHTLFPRDRQTPERGPAREHGARSERECLDDVGPAPDAAVDEHLDPALEGVGDLTEDVDRRRHAVELPAAVIRDDDAGRSVLEGE